MFLEGTKETKVSYSYPLLVFRDVDFTVWRPQKKSGVGKGSSVSLSPAYLKANSCHIS